MNNALTNVLTPAAVDPALDGFTFTSSDGAPFITLDSQRRFYFNAALRKMFGLRAYSKVAIGYQADTKQIAILTKNLENVPPNFSYVLDKRHYTSARKFCAEFRINYERGPYTYVFDRGTSTDGVYIFKLAQGPVIDVMPEGQTPLFDTAPRVEITATGRMIFSDFMSVDAYVRYDGKARQLEVSTERLSGAHKVSVGNDGTTPPSQAAIENAYSKSRPVTLELVETTADGVRIYRKAK